MFRIRNEQRQALEKAAWPAFEEDMVVYFAGFAARHCEVLGDAGVRDVIRLGAKNANAYGLTRPGPVRLYIELMFILGSGFDTDPQLPWAASILSAPDIGDQAARADQLYEASMDYHSKVIGLDSEYAVSALRGIHQEASVVFSISGDGFSDEILAFMQRIYPEKCAHTEEAALRSLFPRAHRLAKSFSVTTERAIALFVTSMFAFGHSFDSDLLYPWISGTLRNARAIKDPNARIDRLFEKTTTYIRQMTEYLGQA